jgi:DNA-binding NarL/FixJ family response regulator
LIDASAGLERIAELKSDVPVLALVARDEAIAAIAAGASGALHRDSPPSAISAALLALTEGLAVFDRSFVSSLVPAERPAEAASTAPLAPAETLTVRERQVLVLLAEGLSNKEIATHLEISEHTAKFHVNSILQKLSAQKRVEAVVRAARLGLIEL